MAEGYDSGGTRRVFDAPRLEQAAAELRALPSRDLRQRLFAALLPRAAFGQVPGGDEAYRKLQATLDAMTAEMERVGLDVDDLAVRSLAAARTAEDVRDETLRASRRGGLMAE